MCLHVVEGSSASSGLRTNDRQDGQRRVLGARCVQDVLPVGGPGVPLQPAATMHLTHDRQ
jgi:hypothetical protein